MKMPFKSQGVTHNFWQNYTDLISGLMIIFLVASVGYIVTKDEESKIKAIIKAQKELGEKSKYFQYNDRYQRFECTIPVLFKPNSGMIDNQVSELIAAGKELKKFINEHKSENIDFEILIDGRVNYYKSTDDNYNLSYQRAKALYLLWEKNGVFNNKGDNIHFAGSGAGGVGRYGGDKDRTFIIHVIPYVKK
jgi:hypothetical protein